MWKCECGKDNDGNFCTACGKPKPAPAGVWKCECGAENTGKYLLQPLGFALVALRMTETSVQSAESPVPN